MDYQNGGLKNVDLFFKIISLQCSWFRRFFDNSFHQWKVIPLFFINKTFGEHFKFHSNLDFRDDTVKCFPSFYKSMSLDWKKIFYVNPCVPSCIQNLILWFNKFIQINRKPAFYKKLSLNNINFLCNWLTEMVFLKIGIPLNMIMTYKTISISSGCNL